MKKSKYTKITLLSLLFPAYVAISFVAGNSTKENFLSNDTKQVSSNLNDSVVATNNTSSAYNHTNYFAFSKNNLPSNIKSYSIFAQTNYSMITQTDKGVLGLSSNMQTILFTSYSGQVIWAQSLPDNTLLQTFCSKNGMTASSLKVKEWSYLSNNSDKNWVSFLVTDNSKEMIVALDLDTGLFVPDNSDTNLMLNGDSIFKILSEDNSYDRIFQIGGNALVALKSNSNDSPKLIKYDFDNKTVSITDLSLNYGNSNNRYIASFVYNGSKTYAVTINKTGSSNGTKTSFNEYLEDVSLNNTNVLTINNSRDLVGKYVTNDQNTTLSNIGNFNNVYFYKKIGNDTKLFLLSGSTGNNYLEIYKLSGGTLSKVSSLSLTAYTINSVTYNSNFNKMYIGNSSTTDNTYLATLDLSVESPQIKTIQQSIGNEAKKYFLIPILESKSKEYLIQYNNVNNNVPTYMKYADSSYSSTNINMSYATWWFNSSNDISTSLGLTYLPSGVNLSNITSSLYLTNLKGSASQGTRVVDDANGTLKYSVKITYTASYDSTVSSNFNLTFYLTGLSKTSSYVFTWIDDTTAAGTETNRTNITNLKKNNYANKITKAQILKDFFTYAIKDRIGNNVNITEAMISTKVSSDYGTLTVTIDLSSLNLPTGTPNNKIKFSRDYTGFLSTKDYKVSKKSDADINKFTQTIYPSNLTETEVVNNFLSTSKLTNNLSNWNITISNVDDYNGTVTISASYKDAKSQIPSSEQLPSDYFNVFNNILNTKTFSGFKSIVSNASIKTKPSMTDLTSDSTPNSYLPSEIWSQYLEYASDKSSISKNEVILLKNLSSTLINTDDLIIDKDNAKVVDTDSTTSDHSVGYIEFKVKLNDGALTNVDYTGTQYKNQGGKLVINQDLQSKIGYPYTIKWNINTYNKFFTLKDKNGNSLISENPNVYEVDLNSNKTIFSDISNKTYSNALTESDISSLIDTKGYNYNITLDSNLNKGYVKATINLTLQDKPLSGSDLTSNPNFTKTIYIYNFKVPMSENVKLMILTAICFASSAVIVIAISQTRWITRKIKYKVLLKSSRDLEVRQRKLENLSKKKRYFKDK